MVSASVNSTFLISAATVFFFTVVFFARVTTRSIFCLIAAILILTFSRPIGVRNVKRMVFVSRVSNRRPCSTSESFFHGIGCRESCVRKIDHCAISVKVRHYRHDFNRTFTVSAKIGVFWGINDDRNVQLPTDSMEFRISADAITMDRYVRMNYALNEGFYLYVLTNG